MKFIISFFISIRFLLYFLPFFLVYGHQLLVNHQLMINHYHLYHQIIINHHFHHKNLYLNNNKKLQIQIIINLVYFFQLMNMIIIIMDPIYHQIINIHQHFNNKQLHLVIHMRIMLKNI